MTDMSTQSATGLGTACASGTENVYNTFVERIRDRDQRLRILIQVRQIVKQALDHSGEQP
jgi:phosphoglucomutase